MVSIPTARIRPTGHLVSRELDSHHGIHPPGSYGAQLAIWKVQQYWLKDAKGYSRSFTIKTPKEEASNGTDG